MLTVKTYNHSWVQLQKRKVRLRQWSIVFPLTRRRIRPRYLTSHLRWVKPAPIVWWIGAIFLRRKIETQRENHSEEPSLSGRYGRDDENDNFFLFSPPEFSLVGVVALSDDEGRSFEWKTVTEYLAYPNLFFVLRKCVRLMRCSIPYLC